MKAFTLAIDWRKRDRKQLLWFHMSASSFLAWRCCTLSSASATVSPCWCVLGQNPCSSLSLTVEGKLLVLSCAHKQRYCSRFYRLRKLLSLTSFQTSFTYLCACETGWPQWEVLWQGVPSLPHLKWHMSEEVVRDDTSPQPHLCELCTCVLV